MVAYLSEQNGGGTVGVVLVSFSVTNCALQGMCSAGVFHGMWGTAGVGAVAAAWGVMGATKCWLCCLGGRQVCRCSGSYICGDMLVRLDSIWVMLANVVVGTSVLSTTDDLDNVRSMVCCVDDGGREPKVSGIIENRDSLSGKQQGFLLAILMVVVCCALDGHSQQ